MIFDLAHFPISGPKSAPTAEDYAAEAMLLRMEPDRLIALWGNGFYRSAFAWSHQVAARFDSVGRRLNWASPNLNQHSKEAA